MGYTAIAINLPIVFAEIAKFVTNNNLAIIFAAIANCVPNNNLSVLVTRLSPIAQ